VPYSSLFIGSWHKDNVELCHIEAQLHKKSVTNAPLLVLSRYFFCSNSLKFTKIFVPLRRERRQGWKAGALHKHLCLLVSGNYQTKIETI
jgi:hypothetical protein